MAKKNPNQTEIEIKPVDVLEHALQLITDPKHWIQGAFARDVDGYTCGAKSQDACCYCAFGAIRVAAGESNSLGILALSELAADLPTGFFADNKKEEYETLHSVTFWQDHPTTTHADVLNQFKKTIARLHVSI